MPTISIVARSHGWRVQRILLFTFLCFSRVNNCGFKFLLCSAFCQIPVLNFSWLRGYRGILEHQNRNKFQAKTTNLLRTTKSLTFCYSKTKTPQNFSVKTNLKRLICAAEISHPPCTLFTSAYLSDPHSHSNIFGIPRHACGWNAPFFARNRK